jgi:hypothetical protein
MLVYHAIRSNNARAGLNVEKLRPFNPIIFVVPALCDAASTVMLFVGLTMVRL